MDSHLRNGGQSGRFTSVLLLVSLFLCGMLASALFFSLRRQGAHSQVMTPVSSTLPATAGSEPGHSGGHGENATAEPENPARGDSGRDIQESRRGAIVQAAQKAGPAVVTVGVTKTRLVRSQRPVVDPFDLFFHRYLPDEVYEQKVPAMGSGFVVDESGIILTNEHVVRDGSDFQVILSDGRTLNAHLLGADAGYDLAVLKVDATGLPVSNLGSSDDLMVGEWAIAIGNPFGFYLNDHQPTVTVGVISAIHRDVKSDEETEGVYKDMIQTDAAINPGNSGGPLVNSLGQVIGINTFIFTQGGGSVGIGFAIPIETAIRVSREIIQYGRSRPVWIGIEVRAISPWVAMQLGLPDTQGLLVMRMDAGSPAERAGIRHFDVIREINGKKISDPRVALRTIFGAQVGDIINFTIERGGKLLKIPLKVEAAPSTGS